MHPPARIGAPAPRPAPPPAAQSARRPVTARAAPPPPPPPPRRGVLAGLVAGVVLVGSPPPASADDEPAVATSTAPETFSTPEFSIAVPAGFDFAPPPGGAPSSTGPALTAEERGRRGRGAAPPENPVKARFVRPCGGAGDGTTAATTPSSSCELTIVARSASAIKPTLLQLTDMAQWGTAADVGRLLLPRGSRATAPPAALSVPRPPRDTGTPVGTVATPPLTLYAYEFEVGSAGGGATRVALAAAARAGRVFVAAAAAPAGEWGAVGGELTQAVRSLRVTSLK